MHAIFPASRPPMSPGTGASAAEARVSLRLGVAGQAQRHARAVRFEVAQLDAAADVAGEAAHHGEAEAGAALAGAEERANAARQQLGREAGAVIGHGDAQPAVVGAGVDADRAAATGERTSGVEDEVEEGLAQAA